MFTNLTRLAKNIKNNAVQFANNALDTFRQNEFAFNTADIFNGNLKFFGHNSRAENLRMAEAINNAPVTPENTHADSFHPYNFQIRDAENVSAEDLYERMREYDKERLHEDQPAWPDLPQSEQDKYVAFMDDMDHGRPISDFKTDGLTRQESYNRKSFMYEAANDALDKFYFDERVSERRHDMLKNSFPRNSSDQVIDIATRAAYENLNRYDEVYKGRNTVPWDQLSDQSKSSLRNIVKAYDNDQEPLRLDVPDAGNPRDRLAAFRSIARQSLQVAQTGNYEQTVENVSHFVDQKYKREAALETGTRAVYEIMRDVDQRLYHKDTPKWEDISDDRKRDWMNRVDMGSRGIDYTSPENSVVGVSGIIERELGSNNGYMSREDMKGTEYYREKYKLEYFNDVSKHVMDYARPDNYDSVLGSAERYHENHVGHTINHYSLDSLSSDKQDFQNKQERYDRNEELSKNAIPEFRSQSDDLGM